MKGFFVGFLVLALALTAFLPLYLGPDDIYGCRVPEEVGRCAKADAIIAISGGDTKARTKEAIRLYKEGWSNRLIFSGAAADKDSPSNAEVMKQIATQDGVPLADISIEEFSANTAENAENTAEIARAMDLKRVLLVTSAYHQRRASIEFSKQLGESVQIVNHPVANDNQWSSWWWMTPYGWVLGLSEVVKILFAGAGVL